MVMYRDQNAGQNHNIYIYIYIYIGIKCFESVEQVTYLGTNVTYQNSIRIRLTTGNAWCHSVQNLLYPSTYLLHGAESLRS
jgi:uncharacterized protein involved in tellurium resistance